MNVKTAENILQQLASQGVRTIALCPGGRNAPFVAVLAQRQGFEVWSFYDERSASFFALGRAQRDQTPAVVLTTSGTAVTETYSAVVEAHYTATPLVVVSADRPHRLRGTGAPQTIMQKNIFADYALASWDISAGDHFELRLPTKGPCHLNVAFDEPLLDQEISSQAFTMLPSPKSIERDQTEETLRLEKPLVVVSGLPPVAQPQVAKSLESFTGPIFLEALSGLRNHPEFAGRLLHGGSKTVSKFLQSGEVKSVLRIGDVPLGRFWRDLDQWDIPTYCLSDRPFTGMEKATMNGVAGDNWSLDPFQLESWDWSSWQEQGSERQNFLQALVERFPQSEVGLMSQLSRTIPQGDHVYLGNSLPVRLWDLVSCASHELTASRGANGIDGQISTAMGRSYGKKTQWAILGDLTTLYDQSAFWISPGLRENSVSFNLVVINNSGGQIFSRLYAEPSFRNLHTLNFKALAEMWSWNYQCLDKLPDQLESQGLNLFEVVPDAKQTQSFWQEFDKK